MTEPTPPTPPPTPPPAAGASNKTVMLVLSYLGLLALIPLLTEKDDKEVQWHAKHGIVLMIAFTILWVLAMIVSQIPVLGCFLLIIFPVIGIAWLIVTIVAIVKATQGQRFIIPGLSDFADKF